MTYKSQISQLKNYFSDIKKIDFIKNLLKWDQQVYMPEDSNKGRSELIAFIDKVKHEKLISEKTGKLIKSAEKKPDLNLIDSAILREAKRAYHKAVKVPTELIEKIAKQVTIGHKIWEKARNKSDFSIFKPILKEIINLKKEYADKVNIGPTRYDSLLDDYEPGAKAAWIDSLFISLKPKLLKIIDKIIRSNNKPETAILKQDYSPKKQWEFSLEIIRKLNFDFNIGRQDKSVHPFTMALSSSDVRITTRIIEDYLPACIFGTIHECGHALYDMGFMEEIHSTNLAEVTSLGIHESQSRLWETIIGRSKEFWDYFYPILQTYFPVQLKNVSKNYFYRALNNVEQSLIRVEADEVTYSLHIILRYVIEKMIFEDKIEIDELPHVWNEKMERLLNIIPTNDATGILQDVHWSDGSFGYFPTYTLGNLYAAQIFFYVKQKIPSILQEISQGNFANLLAYLRQNIHKFGSIYYPQKLIKRVTGEFLDPKYFIDYLKKKFYPLYQIS
jgi:carboxypeptidase Taq